MTAAAATPAAAATAVEAANEKRSNKPSRVSTSDKKQNAAEWRVQLATRIFMLLAIFMRPPSLAAL